MSSDIAIKVDNLSKCYQIYDTPRDRLKQFVLPRLQSLIGLTPKIYYREFWALKDVSFEVKKGETVGVIGRNGCGKSTLLQMICGTLNPTGGNIRTNGRIAALLELGSGFNPEFTGRENVYMNGSVLGLSKEEIDDRFENIILFADIGDFIEQPVKTYSSGMLVRLAFSVIAHVDADILIIDEALAVGDAFFTQKCMRFLREFMKKGTILFVSHDTPVVVNLCKNAVLMDYGKVIANGKSKDVVGHYLSNVYAAHQETKAVDNNIEINEDCFDEPSSEYRDMRQEIINSSSLRNDIQVFKFDLDGKSEFGAGGASIVSVYMYDTKNIPLTWVVGGEDVILEIQCKANKELQQPIIGFLFKDRIGQVIFADNTYSITSPLTLTVKKNQHFFARFEFRMPVLPSGDYSISPAVGEGSQEKHIQHHWINDALLIRIHASFVCHGIVGIPMKNIEIKVKD